MDNPTSRVYTLALSKDHKKITVTEVSENGEFIETLHPEMNFLNFVTSNNIVLNESDGNKKASEKTFTVTIPVDEVLETYLLNIEFNVKTQAIQDITYGE